jgi:hypothetical protein
MRNIILILFLVSHVAAGFHIIDDHHILPGDIVGLDFLDIFSSAAVAASDDEDEEADHWFGVHSVGAAAYCMSISCNVLASSAPEQAEQSCNVAEGPPPNPPPIA